LAVFGHEIDDEQSNVEPEYPIASVIGGIHPRVNILTGPPDAVSEANASNFIGLCNGIRGILAA
jgi:hypothetical protein